MSENLPSLRIGNCESRYPIVQGGMSTGLSTAELAAAVANEGGHGTIGAVGLGMAPEIEPKEYFAANKDALKYEICKALDLSDDGNIGVNLMTVATDYKALVKVSVENRAKFIVSGAGLPLMLPKLVDECLAPGQEMPALIPIVSSARTAMLIIKRWERHGVLPGAIVVETPNTAGGHLGAKAAEIGTDELSLEHVVPELVKNLENSGYDIPVIAAGGIWDRSDMDKMLKIGAAGVQMATRFLPTIECNASQAFKDRHVNNTDPIVVIESPVGMPGRAIENDFVKRTKQGELFDLGPCVGCLTECRHRKDKLSGYCIIRALDIVRRGDVEKGILFSGSRGHQLKQDRDNGIVSAHQIMQELTS